MAAVFWELRRVTVSHRRMRLVGQFGQKGMKEYRRGEYDAEVYIQRVGWMLRGEGRELGLQCWS